MTGNTDSLSATPSYWLNNPNRPVEQVSWDDIQVFLTRLNAREAGNIPAGWGMCCPRKPSGSMPAGQARPPRTHGEKRSVQAMQTGIMEPMPIKPRTLVSTLPILGASLTCMAMYGNGRRMLGVPMHRVHKPIHSMWGPRARTVSIVVRTATGTGLRSAHRNSIDPSSPHGNIGFRVGFKHQ